MSALKSRGNKTRRVKQQAAILSESRRDELIAAAKRAVAFVRGFSKSLDLLVRFYQEKRTENIKD